MSTGREKIQEEGLINEDNESLEDILEDNDDEDYSEIEEESEEETARETVERVLKEQKEQIVGQESEEEDKPSKSNSAKVKQVKPVETRDGVQQIDPPSRLRAEGKAAFSKLPPDLQKEWARIHKDEEAQFTKTQQESRAELEKSREIRENVEIYLSRNPHLIEANYTPSKLINGLLATHQKLSNSQDKVTQIQTAANILSQIGIEDKYIIPILEAYTSGTSEIRKPAPQPSPEFASLQEKVNRLELERVQQMAAPIVSEMEAVRNEKDSTGQYMYPELFEDDFLDRVKPLVATLVGNVPNLSYGDALRRAYSSLTGKNGNSNYKHQVTKLPANENKQPLRASSAAISVRGKSAPSFVGEATEIPKEALGSARESARWALEQLRRG